MAEHELFREHEIKIFGTKILKTEIFHYEENCDGNNRSFSFPLGLY